MKKDNEISYCVEDNHVNSHKKVSFCCVIPIPNGFELVPHCYPKVAYSLECLAICKDVCRKTVPVEGCGQAEIDLHVLKVKGCIPYIVNIEVRPTCEWKGCSTDSHSKEITLCCKESVCIDEVLQCSVHCVDSIDLNCENVKVCDLSIQISDCMNSCHLAKISGYFQFC
ncbi:MULTISPECIES: ABC transporter permease [Bacillus cereus group]|uniref:ABC transporter permease n=1 Tax=Bacillus cereus group TaxID=86661 RepID=UPI00124E6A0A|nr:ABC transporter permease [Bacillus cereus]KAB2421877.1 ABC transporter permease [Bacillus cereus]